MGVTLTVDDIEFYLGPLATKAGVDPSDLVEVTLVLGDGRTVHIEARARLKKKPPTTEPEWLTREQTQSLLQLSRPTVEKLFKSGQLAATKIGRQWRVRRSDLDQFLAGQRK